MTPAAAAAGAGGGGTEAGAGVGVVGMGEIEEEERRLQEKASKLEVGVRSVCSSGSRHPVVSCVEGRRMGDTELAGMYDKHLEKLYLDEILSLPPF